MAARAVGNRAQELAAPDVNAFEFGNAVVTPAAEETFDAGFNAAKAAERVTRDDHVGNGDNEGADVGECADDLAAAGGNFNKAAGTVLQLG
jgi:hypothetical protein